MHPHVERWARYCAEHKATPLRTLEYKIARKDISVHLLVAGTRCAVCGGWLQAGYRALIPTGQARQWTTEYIHTAPDWCARAVGNDLLQRAHDAAQDRALHSADRRDAARRWAGRWKAVARRWRAAWRADSIALDHTVAAFEGYVADIQPFLAAARAYRAAVEACDGIADAEKALFAALDGEGRG